MKKTLIAFTLLLFASLFVQAQKKSYIQLLQEQPHWVDSVFNKLSLRQKIAQMFFVRGLTNQNKAYEDSVAKMVRRGKVGGIIFFQGGPGRQAALTNRYQKLARLPLLVAADGEWGLGMRLDSTVSYPYQMALGAVQNKSLIYKMGLEVAKDFRRLGMQMNLAPVVDINNNAKNPVINYRSFGENKYNVAEKAGAYMKGLQDGGLLVSIKHFPGHGDTDVDSHYDLPQLPFTKQRLDTLELYPFKELIKQHASGVMIAHMNIPSLDAAPRMPSTLSQPIVTGLLKNELGFKGLIISDAMEMKGVVKYFPNGEADVMAIIAGNDIIELSEDTRRAIKMVKQAIQDQRLSEERINHSVKKILTAKYWARLNHDTVVNTQNVNREVTRPISYTLQQQLANASMTLLRNNELIENFSPTKRTVIINVGTPATTVFQKELAVFYQNNQVYNLDKSASATQITKILAGIKPDDQVIIGIFDTRTRPNNGLNFGAEVKQFLANMAKTQAAFTFFANPYNLINFTGLEQAKFLLIAYQKEDFMQRAAASVLKNQLIPTGKLPITVNQFFRYGDGI